MLARLCALVVFSAVWCFASTATAQNDVDVQGEYLGALSDKLKFGAHVLARGEGRFEAVLLSKGLPGEGWDGRTRVLLNGERQGSAIVFSGRDFAGRIEKGVFHVTAGNLSYKLERVERSLGTLNEPAPKAGTLLFGGEGMAAWSQGAKATDGLLQAGARTREPMSSCRLHLEFRLPFEPNANGLDRGAGAVVLADQYEIVLADTFGAKPGLLACGAIRDIAPPKLNVCLPPGRWQALDVEFEAPRFDDDGEKLRSARVTAKLNGVLIHDKVEIPHNNVLVAKKPAAPVKEMPQGVLALPDRGDKVEFRNVWIGPRTPLNPPPPPMPTKPVATKPAASK